MNDQNNYRFLKKFIAPTIVTGSIFGTGLYLGSLGEKENYDALLPIKDKTFQSIENAVAKRNPEYNALIENAELSFDESIADAKLDIGEMIYIDKQFKKAKDYAKVFTVKPTRSEGSRLLEKLVSKNINGLDLGKPELQKHFEELGLEDIFVENMDTTNETFLVMGFSALGALGLMIYSMYRAINL